MSVIVKTDLEFVREKLKSPFGFKGRYLDELWQTVALVATERHTAVAPATESVLWSDGAVFGENPPAAAKRIPRVSKEIFCKSSVKMPRQFKTVSSASNSGSLSSCKSLL